jgi:5'-deoxynucleotidase
MEDRSRDRYNESRAPLVDLYRLGTTHRWQVVHTSRLQTVAEHSYHVTVLALRIAQVIGMTTEEQLDVMRYALIHDAEEAWTGDVPSPVKRWLDKAKVPLERLLGPWYRHAKPMWSVTRGVVKVADIAESVKFLSMFSDTKHGRYVQNQLADTMDAEFEALKAQHGDYFWDLADSVIRDYLHGPETYIDDYL